MPTLPQMGLVTPTLNGDSGAWDDKINACFALVDAHDHTSGKGPRITPSAMNINANLGFGGYAITAAGQVAFTAVAALAAGSKILYVSSADNELYWRTNGGTNVKLTAGNSINTSLVGGIGGDYSTVGADLDYSDANKIYTLKDETGEWARIGAGTVRIFEHSTTESVYVELACAAGTAAPLTVTFPAALPAATSLMTISAAGQVALDGVLGANQSITLSGTGRYKHGDFVVPNAGFGGLIGVAATSTLTSGNFPHIDIGNNGEAWFPVPVRVGARFKGIEVLEVSGVATITRVIYFGGSSQAFSLTTPSATRLTFTTPFTSLTNGESVAWLKYTTNGSGSVSIYSVAAVYDEV